MCNPQTQALKFWPDTGTPVPSETTIWAEPYRCLFGQSIPTPWTFDPWTGRQRSASEIACDPYGYRIINPIHETPVVIESVM
jgi:hypothetical protein